MVKRVVDPVLVARWDDALGRLVGAKIIAVDYGEMGNGGEPGDDPWGQSFSLFLEGGGSITLGAVVDPTEPHSIGLRAEFIVNDEPYDPEATPDGG